MGDFEGHIHPLAIVLLCALFLAWTFIGFVHIVSAMKNTLLRKAAYEITAKDFAGFLKVGRTLSSFVHSAARSAKKRGSVVPLETLVGEAGRTASHANQNRRRKSSLLGDIAKTIRGRALNRSPFAFKAGRKQIRKAWKEADDGAKRWSERHMKELSRDKYRIRSSVGIVRRAHSETPDEEIVDILKRVSTATSAILKSVDRRKNERAVADALAIISQEGEKRGAISGKEDAKCFGLTLKRWFGWGVIYFEFPLLWVQPFLLKGVWPPVVEEPMMQLGKESPLYSIFAVHHQNNAIRFFSLLVCLELCRALIWYLGRKRRQRRRYGKSESVSSLGLPSAIRGPLYHYHRCVVSHSKALFLQRG